MLRILSRSLPRAAAARAAAPAMPRIAASALCAARPAAIQQPRPFHTAVASRSAPPSVVEGEEERVVQPLSETAPRVVSALAADLAAFETSDEYAEKYIKEHNMTVKVNLTHETVVCTREVSGHKVQVSWRTEALEQEDEEEEENEGEPSEKLPEHKFNVDVTNPKGTIMRLECYNSTAGELEVGSLSFPSSVSADPATVSRVDAEKELENAPNALNLQDMQEESSDAFFNYLQSIGIDDDLAVFVAAQSQLVRTQGLIARLTKLKDFAQQ